MIKAQHGKIPTWYDQFCKFEEEKLMKEVIKLAKTLVFSGSFLADK